MSREMYKRLRPDSFDKMVGAATRKSLAVLEKFLKKGTLPQSILLTGGPGMGKTSVARILRKRLDCGDEDYEEIDCASDASLELTRDLKRKMRYRPLNGACRVFYLDEAQSLSRVSFAQQSLLKALEDTPEGVYFILAATSPEKLHPAILSRCTRVDVHPLKDAEMLELLNDVCISEQIVLEEQILDAIAERAMGAPRQGLVLLEAVVQLATVEEQKEYLNQIEQQSDWFTLLRALLYTKTPKWSEVAKQLKEIKATEVESLRKYVLSSATTELLKGNTNAKRAACVIARFENNFFDSGHPGLVLAFYDCISGK